MSRLLDWEKASRQEQARRDRRRSHERQREQSSASAWLERQMAMRSFAEGHKLACFKCGRGGDVEIAKTGTSRRGPWMLCVPCAKGTKQAR